MAKTVRVYLDDAKLQQIIKATGGGVKRRIIADGTDYGIFVELSTSKMAAQPFLVPAFEKQTQGLGRALGQAVERGVNLDNVMSKVAFDIQRMAQDLVPVDTGNLENSLHVEEE